MAENFTDIGVRISEQMGKLNLKQVDICKITGISKNAISNYVNGNRVPDTMAIYKLSKVLKVSIEWLLTGEETILHKENFLDADPIHMTDEEKELIEKYRSGLYPIFDSDIKRLTGDVGRLNDQEHDLILKYRELEERERDDVYDNVCWKYDRLLKKKVLSRSKNGGSGEEAATDETA